MLRLRHCFFSSFWLPPMTLLKTVWRVDMMLPPCLLICWAGPDMSSLKIINDYKNV